MMQKQDADGRITASAHSPWAREIKSGEGSSKVACSFLDTASIRHAVLCQSVRYLTKHKAEMLKDFCLRGSGGKKQTKKSLEFQWK